MLLISRLVQAIGLEIGCSLTTLLASLVVCPATSRPAHCSSLTFVGDLQVRIGGFGSQIGSLV